MCALAIGIIRGLAKYYDEQLLIVHTQCMLNGAPDCRIEVETVAGVGGLVKTDLSA
jgi:hypothetical protein